MASFVSCNKEEVKKAVDPNLTYVATLSGANEVPANASTATGSATLIYNTDTRIFTLSVTHTIAAPTAGHIHKAAVGIAGGVIYPFASPVSPVSYTSGVLDAAKEADLYNNLNYVNIHTAAFPGGEIRGQLLLK
jgi:hypothetical protein